MTTRFGVRIPPCAAGDELAAVARRAEEAGFDSIWMPDSQLLWRDVFISLTAAARATERVQVGTAVTNLQTRHPSVIASAVRTVQDAAPGRVALGVGTGNSALAGVGLRPTRQATMRDGLAAVRALLGGERYDFGDGPVELRDPAGVPPIYVAANGPRNLALAGELGAGVILLAGVAEAALGRGIAAVESGAAGVGRTLADLDVTVTAYCRITDDVERDARLLKPICAGIAQTGGSPFLRQLGIDISVPADVPDVTPDLIHADDWAHAIEVCSRWVSDADAVTFATGYCLFGTAEQVIERLRRAIGLGVDSVLLQHVGSYDLPIELIDEVGAAVLPAFAG